MEGRSSRRLRPLTPFEHLFDDGHVSALAAAPLDPARPVVEQLRERVQVLERRPAREPVPTHPALADLVPMRAGATYTVDSATLALAMAAGASRAGEWVGFAGWRDFGAEAAAALGIDLTRTVLVPDPGEHWVEVTAALVDVLRVVVLRPPSASVSVGSVGSVGAVSGVSAKAAGVLGSRLRTRSAALVVWGDWPGCDARLTTERSAWSGPGDGAGRLRTRSTRLAVRRGTRPAQRVDLVLTDGPAGLTCAADDALPSLVAVGPPAG